MCELMQWLLINTLTSSQCYCGQSSVPYKSSGCPSCGYGRCGNCNIAKVQITERSTRTYETPSKHCRKGLPIVFNVDGRNQQIMATYDTGTLENHISLKLATSMGYKISFDPKHRRELKLANGTTIKAAGRITAKLRFARAVADDDNSVLTCEFNVFEELVLPALVGIAFLQATETLSKHSSRLIDLPSDLPTPLHVCAIGAATNQVSCEVDGNIARAHADTGSGIALISGEYALKHGLLREYGCEKLMLADGSIDYTSGYADIEVKVVKKPGKKGVFGSQKVRFHILKNLQFDVVLDEQLVADFQIFQRSTTFLFTSVTEAMPWLAPIIRLGSMEEAVLNTSEKINGKIREWTRSLLSSKEGKKPRNSSPSK